VERREGSRQRCKTHSDKNYLRGRNKEKRMASTKTLNLKKQSRGKEESHRKLVLSGREKKGW